MRLLILLFLPALLQQSHGLASLTDLAASTVDIISGIVQSIPEALPTPAELFELQLNAVMAYPLVAVSTILNILCSAVLEQDAIQPRFTPDIDDIKLQLRTGCRNESYSLLDTHQMWHSAIFDPSKKVVIYSSGWTSTVNDSDSIVALARAYDARGDTNFVALDVANYINTLYTWSAFNTDAIGRLLAVGVAQLVELVPLQNVHLMGHSLGAQIMGATARHFRQLTGQLLPHVTGLDPAKLCFNQGEELATLARGDAAFVDIVHTNPGVLSMYEPVGDLDYYAGGMQPIKSGCLDIACSHELAWRIYAETVYPGNEQNFLATRCSSLRRLRLGRCIGAEYAMGYAVPLDLKGNFISPVNAAAFYEPNATFEYAEFGVESNCCDCEKEEKLD